MIRKLFSAGHEKGSLKSPRRNLEIQRIETFSDGVFAFAVTLLIVSLEVPKSFEELLTTMRGFFAFGISFLIACHDLERTTPLFQELRTRRHLDNHTERNTYFLLYYSMFIRLKFLFTLMFSDQIYGANNSPFTIKQSQFPMLMMIYALGFMAIYSLFFLMYLHASRKSIKLV